MTAGSASNPAAADTSRSYRPSTDATAQTAVAATPVNRHRKLRHFRHRKVSHPRPGLGPCSRSGSALAAPAVPLLAHGFRVWLRWLSSVLDAGGAVPAVFPSDLLGWRRWRLAADAY